MTSTGLDDIDQSHDATDIDEAARKKARYYTGLLWHAGSFIIINAFLWLLDSLGPGGINWAYWITGVWGFGLAFHLLAWLIDGRQVEERKIEQYRRHS